MTSVVKRYPIFIFLFILLISITSVAQTNIPYWLTDYEELYRKNPREASQAWFKEAKFGMFIHLNLASLCENGKADYNAWRGGEASDRLLEYVGIRRAAYEAAENKDVLLYNKYTLEKFDPDAICKLALKAKMKYITFTTAHLGRCYNFKTSLTDFNSLNAPCGRDLVAEMVAACKKHGLVFFPFLESRCVEDKDGVGFWSKLSGRVFSV